MSVTIKDVAKAAGVSIASVSRVMSGKPGVSAETEENIRRVMAEYGYRPNLGARSLVQGRTGNIAIVFPRGSSFILGNPFFARVLEGVAIILDQKEYNMVISFTTTQQKRLLGSKLVDGVIMFAPREGELNLQWLEDMKLPTTVVGSHFEEDTFPVVRPDDKNGIKMAVTQLYEMGHRKIVLVNGPLSSMKSLRCKEGCTEVFSELGLAMEDDSMIEIKEFDAAETSKEMERFFENSPGTTGVVCAADYLAMGVVKAAGARGLSIPEDLSVVGFGDVLFTEYFNPPLSTVHVDLIGMGKQAAQILIDLIQGKHIRKRERVFPMSFIQRSTTGPPKA